MAGHVAISVTWRDVGKWVDAQVLLLDCIEDHAAKRNRTKECSVIENEQTIIKHGFDPFCCCCQVIANFVVDFEEMNKAIM